MADIKLVNDGSVVTVDFTFKTPQQFFYTVEVTDDLLIQSFHGIGKSGGITSFTLGVTGSLIGKFLNITWAVIDPAGTGNAYTGTAVASQNGHSVPNAQVCIGTTSASASNVGTTGQFTT